MSVNYAAVQRVQRESLVPNVREGERERQGNMPCRVATKRFHALGYIRMGAKKL